MYHKILRDASFYSTLLQIDKDIAAAVRASGCPCGGRLHSARYPRKPRGGPDGFGPEHDRRLSFCCAEDGCRQRVTPPSVRFLGRRVYFGVVVLLLTVMCQGVTERRAAALRHELGVSRRTLERWRGWWREAFVASAFWRGARGHLVPEPEVEALPGSLLERFGATLSGVTATLRFLSPLTTTWCAKGSSIVRGQ